MRVKLKTKFGQFWDRKLRWGIAAGEVKDLPEPLPQDTLTYQKLRMGGFQIVKDDAATCEAVVTDPPAKEEPIPPVGQAMPDDSDNSVIEGTGKTAATDRPTKTEPIVEPVHPAGKVEPVVESTKPAPKKRGRPKKTK